MRLGDNADHFLCEVYALMSEHIKNIRSRHSLIRNLNNRVIGSCENVISNLINIQAQNVLEFDRNFIYSYIQDIKFQYTAKAQHLMYKSINKLFIPCPYIIAIMSLSAIVQQHFKKHQIFKKHKIRHFCDNFEAYRIGFHLLFFS